MKEDLENNRWTPAKHPRAKEDPILMIASKSLEGHLVYPSSNWTRSNRELRRSSEQASSEVIPGVLLETTWGARMSHLGPLPQVSVATGEEPGLAVLTGRAPAPTNHVLWTGQCQEESQGS